MSKIDKKDFVNLIDAVERLDKLGTSMYSYGIDIVECDAYSNIQYVIISYLDKLYKTEAVSWWCWEVNFGEYVTDGCVSDENGNDITPKTIDELYEYCEGIE